MLRSGIKRFRTVIIAAAAMAVAGAAGLFFLQPAAGHGTATSPPSRHYSCWERWGDDFQNPDMAEEDPMCWQAWQADPNAMWNWNGLLREGMQDQHEQLIPDGALCSGGNAEGGRYDSLDEVGPWHATPMDNQFTLHYEDVASHGGDYYWVYLTRQGFDVTSDPLGWGDLEKVVETGAYAPGEAVDIPVDAGSRTGHHVVYVIWQASHLDQTFYSCSDVWFGDGGQPDPTEPDPTEPGGSGECEADYSVANDWGSGFTGSVEVTATSGSGAWEVSWEWPGDQQITNSWSATIDASGSSVTATGEAYNATLSEGESTSFGFNAGYSGSNTEPELTCTLG